MDSVQEAVAALPAGKYIVAVSGGVDSMALLEAMRKTTGLSLVVVHANHGIRSDSSEDEVLVAQYCMSHNIVYTSKELHLSPTTSENHARKARYRFLQTCRIAHNADSIVTAHHQDDIIETALINILRGTGWRGMAPFVNSKSVLRPLENMTKDALITYAKTNNVPWRTDSTNADQRYLRNYVRLTLMPMLNTRSSTWRQDFLRLIRISQILRRTIEDELNMYLTSILDSRNNPFTTSRYIWCMLPDPVAYEVFQHICRQVIGTSMVRPLAEAALIFAKTALPKKNMPLNDKWQLRVTRHELIVEPQSSVVK